MSFLDVIIYKNGKNTFKGFSFINKTNPISYIRYCVNVAFYFEGSSSFDGWTKNKTKKEKKNMVRYD